MKNLLVKFLCLALIPAFLLSSGCSKGPYEEDEQLWIDIEAVAGGNDGYIVGRYDGVEQDKVLLLVDDIEGAEEHPLAIKARSAGEEPILVALDKVKPYSSGSRDYKARKQLEGQILSLFRNVNWQSSLSEDVKRLSGLPGAQSASIKRTLGFLAEMGKIYDSRGEVTNASSLVEYHTRIFEQVRQTLEADNFGRAYDLISDVFLKYYLKQHAQLLKLGSLEQELEQLVAINAPPEQIANAQKNLKKAMARHSGFVVMLRDELFSGILGDEIGEGFTLRNRALAYVAITNMFETASEHYQRQIQSVLLDSQLDREDKLAVMKPMVEQAKTLANLLTKNAAVALAESQDYPMIFTSTVSRMFKPFKKQLEGQLQASAIRTTEDAEDVYQKARDATAPYTEALGVDLYTQEDKQRFLEMLVIYQ